MVFLRPGRIVRHSTLVILACQRNFALRSAEKAGPRAGDRQNKLHPTRARDLSSYRCPFAMSLGRLRSRNLLNESVWKQETTEVVKHYLNVSNAPDLVSIKAIDAVKLNVRGRVNSTVSSISSS